MSYSSQQLADFDNYYKLKKQYKDKQNAAISRIMSNNSLTIADKRVRVKELVNKCVNCKQPGGTIFEETNTYLKAQCGAETKCDLDINVPKGEPVVLLPNLLEKIRDALEREKTILIQIKISHALGSISDEEALQEFETRRERLQQLTTASSSVEEKLISVTNNVTTENEISLLKMQLYTVVQEFKDILREFGDTAKDAFLGDAIQKYTDEILPKSEQLRNTIYAISRIEHDIDNMDYRLIQKRYALKDLEYQLKPDMQRLIEGNY